jgi:superoxide dismutase, Fe-Mn family
MAYVVPPLPYDYNALEPFIDEMTMRIHHDKHHGAYVENVNKALAGRPEWAEKPIELVLADIQVVPSDIRTAVNNNGGGHANHTIFWQIMAPASKGGGGEPSGPLAEAINKKFGGFAKFKEQVNDAAMKRFGSGWAWLCLDQTSNLLIESFPNQDSPFIKGYNPIMGVDVWEHAYYLKYQNRRAEYLAAWWNVVNWGAVAERYAKAMGK